MKKFRLLLLDANVVIYLFEIDLWDKLVEHCEVLLSRIVAEREAQFFERDDGQKVYFDLQRYITDGRVSVVDASVDELKAFRDLFDPVYLRPRKVRDDRGTGEGRVAAARGGKCFGCARELQCTGLRQPGSAVRELDGGGECGDSPKPVRWAEQPVVFVAAYGPRVARLGCRRERGFRQC